MSESKPTNETIANTLEQLAKGKGNSKNELVFNPATGEFEMASSAQPASTDNTTINSIVEDGFAKSGL